ncbi:MAG: hypothetical protein WDZ37_05480 [Solirubrobacterales bacterium]
MTPGPGFYMGRPERCARCGRPSEESYLTPDGRCCPGCLTVEEQVACGFDVTEPSWDEEVES